MAFVAVTEVSRFENFLRLFVNGGSAEWSDRLWPETKLMKDVLDSLGWLCSDSKPVPDLMLVDDNLAAVGSLIPRHPKAYVFDVAALEVLFLTLDDKAP